jgi:hypothetical protein
MIKQVFRITKLLDELDKEAYDCIECGPLQFESDGEAEEYSAKIGEKVKKISIELRKLLEDVLVELDERSGG